MAISQHADRQKTEDILPADGSPFGASAPGRVGRPRSVASEQAILDAALELVVELGYDKLTMDALAERARASKATIYRHWSGKAEVVADAIRGHATDAMPADPDTGTLRGDLLAFLEMSCDALEAEDGPLLAAVLWAMRTDPALASLVRGQMVDQKRRITAGAVTRAAERGDCRADVDPMVICEVMESMVMSRLLFTGDPLDNAFCLHLVDDVVLPLVR